MDPVETKYGAPTPRKCTVKELVNPPKTPYQVLWDSQVGHDLYKKTHGDYNMGEHVDRNYIQPPYDPDKRFGMPSNFDQRGMGAKCACNWYNNNPVSTIYSLQADSEEYRQPQLGKVLAPHKNIECVPKEHTFGAPTKKPFYGLPELLKDPDCPPCIENRDFNEWMAVLNHLRNYLKRRYNNFGFRFKDFYDHCLFFDQDHSGWLSLDIFYQICKCYTVIYEKAALEPLLRHLGTINGDKINYKSFIYLADINTSLPLLVKFNDLPERIKQYYISSSRAADCDFLTIDNSRMMPAGVANPRYNQPYVTVPEDGSLADLEHLGDQTTARALISPSVYTNYGLNYRDFFMPRNPEIIKQIFEKIGYEFPDDTFEKLWKIGIERDKTGLVCVETFKKLLNEALPPHQLIVEDAMEC